MIDSLVKVQPEESGIHFVPSSQRLLFTPKASPHQNVCLRSSLSLPFSLFPFLSLPLYSCLSSCCSLSQPPLVVCLSSCFVSIHLPTLVFVQLPRPPRSPPPSSQPQRAVSLRYGVVGWWEQVCRWSAIAADSHKA